MNCSTSHSLRLAVASCLLSASALPALTAAQENAVVEEVIVTGSRIARPNLTQPTPVSTVTTDHLRMSGNADLGTVLAQLPALGSTGTLAGNTNSFGDNAGLDLPDLRRLGVARTLTLVNGKRHIGGSPGSTAVDLGSIPIAMVERVEVITGGASAVYGSDAVSGVINVITRDDFDGIEVNLQTGRAWEGDYARNYQAALTVGRNFDDERGNFTFSLTRDRVGNVQAGDLDHAREFGTIFNPDDTGENDGIPDTLVVPNVVSERIDENGVLLPFGGQPTSFSRPDGVIAFDNAGNPRPQMQRDQDNSFAFGSFPNGCDFCFGVEDYITIIPDIVRTAFQSTARYRIADPVSFYVDAKFVTSDIQEELQPSFSFGSITINVADNPFLNEALRGELLAAGVTQAAMARFHADAGSRRNNIERETRRIVAGFDGTLGTGAASMSYDVFFNYGETDNTVQGQNRGVPDNFAAAIDAIRDPGSGQIVCRDPDAAVFPGCVPFNPFGRQNSREAVAFSFVQTTEEQRLTQQNAGLSFSSDTSAFLTLPAGPIGWAAGAEWREEKTSNDGDTLVQADLTESAAQPDQTGGYKVTEAFVEVSVPILADKFLADSLTVDAAFRAADYSHAGSANAWKLGAIWAPIEQLRFRATLSEAVRAPNITEAFLPTTPGFEQVNDPCDIDLINDDPDRAANCAALGLAGGIDANDNVSVDTLTGGNRNLDAEESDSYTVGVVYRPDWAAGLSITLDYYDIEITDAITDVEPQDILDNCVDSSSGLDDSFCSLVTRDPATRDVTLIRSTFVNASKLETQGVDLELSYRRPLSDWTEGTFMGWLRGDLALTVTGNYLRQLNEFVFQTRPDEIDVNRGEIGDPIHSYLASVSYRQGKVIARWEGSYVGSSKRYEVGTDICEDVSPCEVDSTVYHDLSLRYQFGAADSKFELFAGVNNVLDEAPPRGILGAETDEAVYSAIGRNYFVGLRSSF